LILAAAAIIVVLAALAAFGTRPWDNLSERFSLFFTIALDVQVLIGAIVWVLGQAWAGDAFRGFIHPVVMLGAVAVAHVGKARTDRASGDRVRGRTALIFYIVSVALVLIAIPRP
jgi:hypothetical protein